MITKLNFEKFEPIILTAVDELFQLCITNEVNKNDFLVFLENGHYDSYFEKHTMNPYLIGQGFSGAKDLDRMSFVEFYTSINFEELYNSETDLNEKYDLRRKSIMLSMMVYTHFWESKVFLRRLRLLALLANEKAYDWHLVIRPTNTYEYIKDNIRDVFMNLNLKIYDIIKGTYRNQIRNAFAHSDFHLSHQIIHLDNYSPSNNYTIESISWDEFDEIIIKTLLLHHCLIVKMDEYRNKLGIESPDREILIPENGGTLSTLHYRKKGKLYRWLWPTQLQPNQN